MEIQKIGYFSRTHGLQGALVLKYTEDYLLDLDKIKFIFLERNKVPTPFKIKDFITLNKDVAILLEDFNTKEKASELINQSVYSKITDLLEIEKAEENQWLGFTVQDKDGNKIGEVVGLQETAFQTLLEVKSGNKTHLLPSVAEFILKLDKNSKILIYNAPEGLLDL